MGTRADFYIGRLESADEMAWLGSIAWDGYPDGIDGDVLTQESPEAFVNALNAFFARRDDVTTPERGWPWPWDDSGTTDWAYCFDLTTNAVFGSNFGRPWHDPLRPESEEDEDDVEPDGPVARFPDMKDRKNVRWDKGSGVIVVEARS